MGFYERRILPKLLDFAMRQPPIMRQREKVVPQALGRVLEIGVGSGLNLAYYDKGRIEKLWGLDPSLELQQVAAVRAREAGIAVEFLSLSAEKIPLDADAVDSVVSTYTLCTIPDVAAALAEIRRVLRPNGRLLFSEHGRAPDAGVERWQNRLNGIWGKIGGGCNLNRPIPEIIGNAGFAMAGLETMYLPGPRPMTFNYWGSAVKI